MPGRKPQARAEDANSLSAAGNFHGFLARNLSDGYRLAEMTLGDPVEAGAVLRGVAMSAWLSTRDPAEGEIDDAFRHRLESGLLAAIREAGEQAPREGAGATTLEAAVAALPPRLQLALARVFGPWELTGRLAPGAGAAREAAAALRTLRARLGAGAAAETVAGAGPAEGGLDGGWAPGAGSGDAPGDGDTESLLRHLYETRDPGEPAPLYLRMRLEQDLGEAEAAAAERARLTRASGWRFVFNAFGAMIVLSLVLAAASIVDQRSSTAAAGDPTSAPTGDPTSDPASPLIISGVSLVEGAIDGAQVHVGATQRTFIMAFAASPMWNATVTDCQADIFGVISWQGQTTWIGEQAGRADVIAGDPSSASAYVAGPGPYCQSGRFASADGGLIWSAGALPGHASASPTWISFDPSRSGVLLAYYPGRLYTSSDAGVTWTSRASTVRPVAFDPRGRLVGWSQGELFELTDDGVSWRETGPGPTEAPVAAGATPAGVFLGMRTGLWWYPTGAAANLVRAGSVFSIAAIGDGAVVLGADPAGSPWLGTVNDAKPEISLAVLPPDLATLRVSGGSVAANDAGAIAAFSGDSSAIAIASFAH